MRLIGRTIIQHLGIIVKKYPAITDFSAHILNVTARTAVCRFDRQEIGSTIKVKEEGRHMRHIRQVSRQTRVGVMKAMDPAGAAFLQIWLAVMSTMLFGAFGGKE